MVYLDVPPSPVPAVLQIAGVAITAVALTAYMGFQWRRSRQQAQAPSTVSSIGTTQTVDETES